uniref:Uncharacterized protein n=1 Tax=Anguilla anguilla TaxID=7936 RepID=A0A0E9U710_ANGAN
MSSEKLSSPKRGAGSLPACRRC